MNKLFAMLFTAIFAFVFSGMVYAQADRPTSQIGDVCELVECPPLETEMVEGEPTEIAPMSKEQTMDRLGKDLAKLHEKIMEIAPPSEVSPEEWGSPPITNYVKIVHEARETEKSLCQMQLKELGFSVNYRVIEKAFFPSVLYHRGLALPTFEWRRIKFRLIFERVEATAKSWCLILFRKFLSSFPH